LELVRKRANQAVSTPEKDWDWEKFELEGQEARQRMRIAVGHPTPRDGTEPCIPFYFCPTWRSIMLSRPFTEEPVYHIGVSACRLSLTRRTSLSLSFREADIRRLEIRIGKGSENRGDVEIEVFLDSGVIHLQRRHHYSPYLIVNLVCAVFRFVWDEKVEVRM
jgi:hypothetical protein